MPTISIGPQFFIKERNNLYSDWVTAFWREYLQNSIDAGATRIDIDIKGLSSGEACAVEFKDDGCGMSREVLERVFFSLGETTKTDGGSVGGFGRARLLTCFSMLNYSIHTGNLLVHGRGSEYTIEDDNKFTQGCQFLVHVPDKSDSSMMSALERVLSKSHISADVYVCGKKWTSWTRTYNACRVLDCGSVYTNKSQPSNGVINVRVKGLWTFDIYTGHKTQVVVEVDPAKSREILTANRDAFHRNYQTNLIDWVMSLEVDKRTALQETKIASKMVKGFGFIISNGKQEDKSKAHDADVIVPERLAVAAHLPQGAYERKDSVLEGLRFGQRMPSIYISCNTTNKDILAVKDNFDPEKWGEAEKRVRSRLIPYRKGANYMKLLVAWRAACEEAVDALLSYRNMEKLRWVIGWTFDDDNLAEHLSVWLDGENGSALCLNPIDGNGVLRYNLTNRQHLWALMALAKHEVAHVVVSAHNEDFSTLHTAIDSRYDMARAMRAMKSAVSAV